MPDYSRLGKSNVKKVNIGWALIIAAGIGSFVFARDQVLHKRQGQMSKAKELIARVAQEATKEE